MSAADDSGQSWLSRIPVYPLILAEALIVVAYMDANITIWAALRPILIAGLLAVVLTLIATLLTANPPLGGITALAVLLIARAADRTQLLGACIIIVLGFAAIGLYARMSRRPALPAVTRLLNIVSLVLAAVVFGQAMLAGVPGHIAADLDMVVSRQPAPSAPTGSNAPDIFVLMLEDYPRADTLRRLFGDDNGAFLHALQVQGLTVSPNSSVSYQYTALNVAAMLQMRYPFTPSQSSTPYGPAAVNNNAVFDELHSRGYTTMSSISRWEAPTLRGADVYCGDGQINEFEFQRLQDMLVGAVLNAVTPGWDAARDRSVIHTQLECTASQIRQTLAGPRFVFAHIDAPHIPVVFGADGAPAPSSVYSISQSHMAANPQEFKRAYVAQLTYVNDEALKLIREIKHASARPAVILVVSDEGYNIDPADSSSGSIPDRMGNLFAASTPGHPELFGPEPLLVNVFPTLLNAYFRTSLPIQPPRYFASSATDATTVTEIPDPFGRAK